MKTKIAERKISAEEYYDTHGVLADILDEDIDLSLEDALRESILTGKRKRNLRNISIKIDPLYIQSIKKIATIKGIPYQTLVRLWLTEKIKNELQIA
jgi:predicted DNA binding CopG/RHH family protein